MELALNVLMLIGGIAFPIYFSKTTWLYVVFVYIFFASVTPMWLLKQPRDYLTTFLFVGMIVAAVVGVLFYNPTISLPAFTGLQVRQAATCSQLCLSRLLVELFLVFIHWFHQKQVVNKSKMKKICYKLVMVQCYWNHY